MNKNVCTVLVHASLCVCEREREVVCLSEYGRGGGRWMILMNWNYSWADGWMDGCSFILRAHIKLTLRNGLHNSCLHVLQLRNHSTHSRQWSNHVVIEPHSSHKLNMCGCGLCTCSYIIGVCMCCVLIITWESLSNIHVTSVAAWRHFGCWVHVSECGVATNRFLIGLVGHQTTTSYSRHVIYCMLVLNKGSVPL